MLTRFNVELDKETSTFILRIRDIQETDGATYQCQVQFVGRGRKGKGRRRRGGEGGGGRGVEERVEEDGVNVKKVDEEGPLFLLPRCHLKLL